MLQDQGWESSTRTVENWQSVPSGSKAVSPAILSYFINGILNHIFFLTVADVCGFHAF